MEKSSNDGRDFLTRFDRSVIASVDTFGTDPVQPFSASVIIVTYNVGEPLDKTLSTLEAESPADFEIIVVDNNEKLDIVPILRKHRVKYVKMTRNHGLCIARNAGLLYARSEILIFLDDDAIPGARLVAEHVAIHRQREVLGVRGKCIPITKNFLNTLAANYDLGEKVIPSLINLEGNSSLKKKFLLDIGGWDTGIAGAGGHEGTDLTFRGVKKYGKKELFLYCPRAIIFHDFATTWDKFWRKQIRHVLNERNMAVRDPEFDAFVQSYQTEVKVERRGWRERIKYSLFWRYVRLRLFLYFQYYDLAKKMGIIR